MLDRVKVTPENQPQKTKLSIEDHEQLILRLEPSMKLVFESPTLRTYMSSGLGLCAQIQRCRGLAGGYVIRWYYQMSES